MRENEGKGNDWVAGVIGDRTEALGSAKSGPAFSRSLQAKHVAILGAGIAGLTAALELKKRNPSLRITLYEATDRVGGHVHTDRTWMQDSIRPFYFERGAELVDENHHALIALAKELRVGLVESNTPHGLTYYHDDGRFFSDQEMQAALQPLVAQAQKDCEEVIQLKANGEWSERACVLDQMSMADYARAHAQEPKWARKLLMQLYRSELGREPDEISALAFVTAFGSGKQGQADFSLLGESDESMKIQGGSDTLIAALESKLKSLGVEIITRCPVTGLEELKTQHRISVTTKPEGLSGPARVAHFDHVIAALPPHRLSTIPGITTLTTAEQFHALEQTNHTNSVKISFETRGKPWLRSPKLRAARELHGESDGFFFTSDGIFQTAWPSSINQPTDSDDANENAVITCLIGGRVARALTPDKLAPLVREHYANMLGLPEMDVFTNRPFIDNLLGYQGVSQMDCYASPGVGQFTGLRHLLSEQQTHPQFSLAGQYIPLFTHGIQIGFMDNAVSSGRKAAHRALASIGAEIGLSSARSR